MDPRAPNLFVLGAPKAGTTFVHHALALTPGVYMSPVKEPGFFSSTRNYRMGLDYYLDAYFGDAAANPLRGESTPWYLYSDEARERMVSLPWDTPPHLLVFVRRPSSRAYSMYHDQRRLTREPRSFEAAIEAELDGLARGELHPDVRQRYVWGGQYVDHIEAWQSAFGPDQVFVGRFEDLGVDPDGVWQQMDAFFGGRLGPSSFGKVDERDRNTGGDLRWPRLDALLRSLEGRDSPLLDTMKRRLRGGHRRVLQQIGRLNRTHGGGATGAPPRANAEVLTRIDEHCRPDTERLEALLGANLDSWKQPAEPSDPTLL